MKLFIAKALLRSRKVVFRGRAIFATEANRVSTMGLVPQRLWLWNCIFVLRLKSNRIAEAWARCLEFDTSVVG